MNALAYCSLFVATLAVGQSGEPAAVDRTEFTLRVQRLVGELDGETGADRDRAERQLIELGPDVLALLPRIDPNTPAELKERLTRVRRTLDEAAAKETTEPSRVTIEGEFTLAELLEKIKQQTGNQIVDFRRGAPQGESGAKLSVEFNEMEFWPALDQILDQAGLTTYTYTGQPRTLGVTSADGEMKPRADAGTYSGVFRLEATEIQAQRNLRSADGGALRVRIEVLWEPRLIPVLIRHAYSDLKVTADNGDEIPVASDQGVAEAPVQSTVASVDLIFPMELPDRAVKKIASLKGRLYAELPGREEEFAFDDLVDAQNVQQQRGGLEVTLERVRKNRAVHEIRLRLRLLDEGDTFQSHLDWVSNNVVYLEGPDGKKIDNPNFERYYEREKEVGYRYFFPVEDVADYRLVYRSPAAILLVPVDYELKDIPLP